MKHKIYLLLLGLTSLTVPASGQRVDTLRTELSTEDEAITRADVKRFIRYITRADVEEKTLFKVGIWPSTDRSRSIVENRSFRAAAIAEVSIEQKVSAQISVLFGLEGSFGISQYRGNGGLLPRFVNENGTAAPPMFILRGRSAEISLKGATRYYFGRYASLSKISNFSGNYVSLQLTQPYSYFSKTRIYSAGEIGTIKTSRRLLDRPTPRLSLSYGIQRRLGRFAYFDINAGPEAQFNDVRRKASFSFQLNALAGFGW